MTHKPKMSHWAWTCSGAGVNGNAGPTFKFATGRDVQTSATANRFLPVTQRSPSPRQRYRTASGMETKSPRMASLVRRGVKTHDNRHYLSDVVFGAAVDRSPDAR
jgi:hypothetical protein